jgi:adenosylcobinamide-phosphate synthase
MIFSSYNVSDIVLIAAMALLVNLLLGSPRLLWRPLLFLHPLEIWRKLAEWLGGKLNRYRRSDQTRHMRGGWLVFLTILASLLLGYALAEIFLLAGGLPEVMVLALFLSARQPFDDMAEVEKLLATAPQTVSSKILPSSLVRRQLSEYDHPTVIRGIIEMLGVSMAERVIAPLFYYIIAGWQGVLLVSLVRVLDAIYGYRNAQYEDFGAISAKTHTLLQIIPARIAGLLIVFASFFAPACSGGNAWQVLRTQAQRVNSLNAGWPIAAMAGALGVMLGGPRALYGSFIADQWVGTGSAQLTTRHSQAARWLYLIAQYVCFMLLLLAGLLW